MMILPALSGAAWLGASVALSLAATLALFRIHLFQFYREDEGRIW